MNSKYYFLMLPPPPSQRAWIADLLKTAMDSRKWPESTSQVPYAANKREEEERKEHTLTSPPRAPQLLLQLITPSTKDIPVDHIATLFPGKSFATQIKSFPPRANLHYAFLSFIQNNPTSFSYYLPTPSFYHKPTTTYLINPNTPIPPPPLTPKLCPSIPQSVHYENSH